MRHDLCHFLLNALTASMRKTFFPHVGQTSPAPVDEGLEEKPARTIELDTGVPYVRLEFGFGFGCEVGCVRGGVDMWSDDGEGLAGLFITEVDPEKADGLGFIVGGTFPTDPGVEVRVDSPVVVVAVLDASNGSERGTTLNDT